MSRTTYYELEKLENFNPSIKYLIRITGNLINKGPKNKTGLALDTKINYTRLAKHDPFSPSKRLVKPVIEENKINLTMTEDGKNFFLSDFK